MGKLYDTLTPELIAFIEAQKLFFVATAPTSTDGHVNLSPKGMDSLRVLDPLTVAYLDVTGSGVETIAHLKDNARMVMMFCAFDGRPLIVRLHGSGEVLERDHAEFGDLIGGFPELPGVRSIIRLNVSRIADSCGWNVPIFEYAGVRDYYDNYAEKMGPAGLRDGQLAGNMQSIDGLTGLDKPSF